VIADLDVHLPGIRAGDAQAFAAWLAGAEPSLRRGLGSFARQVDVEAVLQEALLRTWQVAPRFEPDGRPDGLVRLAQRIATNLAISETRRLGRSTAVDPELLAAGIDAAQRWEPRAPDPLLREKIAGCRDKLPPRPKEALAARLDGAGGVPDATLALRLGMEKNTFLQNFTRARKLVIECLRRAGIDLLAELA
jgi:DNA-directed RNA polymerase specialized sigma24 family protein